MMNRMFDEKLKKKTSYDIFWIIALFQDIRTLKFCNYDIPDWDIVLKLNIWIPRVKIAGTYFFFFLSNHLPL